MELNQKIKTKYDVINKEDSRFIELDVVVCHDGENLNGSRFSLESFEYAKDSLANIPILAHVCEKDGELVFGGHDMEFSEDENGEIMLTYLEQPIGVIPETNDYEIREIDGKQIVCCKGYVWKEYSNLAQKIIEENQEVELSMEIEIHDETDAYTFAEDGVLDIHKYSYRGITLIGSDPAMVGAKATVKFSRKEDKVIKHEYSEMLKALESELNDKRYFSILDEMSVNVSERTIADDFKDAYEMELDKVNFSEYKFMSVVEFEAMQNEVSELKSQIAELEAYKAEVEKEQLFAKKQDLISEYSELLSETEIDLALNDVDETDLMQIEFKLSKAVVAKQKDLQALKDKQQASVILTPREDINYKASKKKKLAL